MNTYLGQMIVPPSLAICTINHGRSMKLAMDQVCRESQNTAMDIYTRLPLKQGERTKSRDWQFCNTLYSEFYIGGRSWKQFKILVDLFIQHNTTRDLPREFLDDIAQFKRIRLLKVDFTIFGAVPANVWAEFPLLEKLTIVIYPFREIRKRNVVEHNRELKFVKPQRGEIHGRRAGWVLKHAKTVLEAVKITEIPGWQIPKLEVLAREPEKGDAKFVVQWWTDDMDEFKKSEGWEESDDEENFDYDSEGSDDDEWFPQAKAVIPHRIPDEDIKKLKQYYHPSRRVG